MIAYFAYLVLALSLAAPLLVRVDGRYVAVATSLALVALTAAAGTPVGVLVALVALALALDWRVGSFGLALSFAAVAAALAVYVYYAAQPVVYGLIALALATAAVYGLLAMGRGRENVEGAVKYLVFSGVGKVLIVVGYFTAAAGWPWGLYLAVLGFMFELGIAPFHAWVVDAYALGSPGGAASLAAFSKVTALFVLLAIFKSLKAPGEVGLVALVVALVSMLVANVAGLTAKTLGRVMAYSSIAHMSYALAAVSLVWWLGEPEKRPSLFGAPVSAADLAILVVVLEGLASGLAKAGVFGYLRAAFSDLLPPRRSVLNVLNVFSLLGLPPLLGFWPKLILALLILSYPNVQLAVFLVVWVVVNSALATPYYLRAVRWLVEAPGPVGDNVTSSYTAFAAVALGVVLPLVAYLLL
ncbi:proton-conducting transporter membrane subunit [Pyrobaculum sp. 3827-6]|uniref:proton-conducting transporter transmembrane domain-containing protein n=1 Tax=Pyrobaculum sp. 3827-6 TaxID=2983604 RepID=UPI0021D945B6|nr:proton-conducting transporter membrane subunit [Pyrobaculum sp. 3827-6]MCU7788367.1 proton-conducting transporter membrane subunit [Pyrobaculum sp. 3827-6]